MPGPICHAAIIAGGASRRMGFPKALVEFEAEILIARAARVLRPLFQHAIVVTQDEEIARAANLLAVSDIFKNKGPLGGVHAALSHFQNPTFCVACDMPFLRADAIEFLCTQFKNCEVLAPRIQDRMETLHAIYAPSCLPVLERELQNEKIARADRVLAPLRMKFVEESELKVFDPDLKFLANLNTPEEWRAAQIALS
jgi:molybdopterin-guanine dinucleotide biosynthesis protein A